MIKERPIQKKFTAWHRQIEAWKAKAPFGYRVTEEVMKSQHMRDHLKGRESEVILPQMAIDLLYQLTQGEASSRQGSASIRCGPRSFTGSNPAQLLTSAGLGAMGYGYPAALGAKSRVPDRRSLT
jgi:acetolactate synthase-1/2/3 large subunit